MNPSNFTARYSADDLAEFKAIIDAKLENHRREVEQLTEQMLELSENGDDHGDWMDTTYNQTEREMLSNVLMRLKKHIRDLEIALVRIQNKNYGICVVTGEIIDKRRLLAVPTTTKCIMAKNGIPTPVEKPKTPASSVKSRMDKPKIISKIIRKPSAIKPVKPEFDLSDDDDDDDDDYIDDSYNNFEFDLDIKKDEEE